MSGNIHFIGAGGVGVSGLAHLALDAGWRISASDIADSAMLQSLKARGVDCFIGHRESLPADTEMVVFSSAVPETDTERAYACQHGIRQVRRGDFLAELALRFRYRIAVSGSHGKTTTTAMIAHILRICGMDAGYMVGGCVNGWERAACGGDGSVLVSEVDESDGSQAGFPATLALVLNIDDDHSWALGGTEALEDCFTSLCRHAQQLLCWRSPDTERLFGDWTTARLLDTSLELDTLIGWHNRINAAMAVEAAACCGIPRPQAIEALKSFPGVSRRLSIRKQVGNRILIEDYAHHPSELAATLDALREHYPHHYLMVVFQPHRNERVSRYGEQFAHILAHADWVGLTEAFGAWRTDGQHCNVQQAIGAYIPQGFHFLKGSFKQMADTLHGELSRHDNLLLAVIGAGDVTKIVPLIQLATDR